MKNIKFKLGIVLSLALLFSSCQDDEGVVGDIIAPSNIVISYEIVGLDASNPNGDGTGIVNFTTSSDNVITYRYDFGDNTDVVAAPSGDIEHTFSVTGLNTYSVTVMASGIGGVTSTSTINIDVFSSFEDVETQNFLTGGAGNSKTWYWAADKPGNIGLGPNDVQPGGEHTYSQWFTSDAWHGDKLCMYPAEFVFTQAADGSVTFEQLTDIIYVNGDYANTIGVDGNICYDSNFVSTAGEKNVTFSPANSIATVDGEYRGTNIKLSDGGFMCWYVGESSSTLEIITITDSTLFLRVEDGVRAWYCKYQTDNPND